jgi:hypothetical protein
MEQSQRQRGRTTIVLDPFVRSTAVVSRAKRREVKWGPCADQEPPMGLCRIGGGFRVSSKLAPHPQRHITPETT